MELSSRPPSPTAAGLHLPALWPGLCAATGPLDPMKPTPLAAPADPVLLFVAVACRLAAEALAALLIVALAVVPTLAGWRPSPAHVLARAPVPPPLALPPPLAPAREVAGGGAAPPGPSCWAGTLRPPGRATAGTRPPCRTIPTASAGASAWRSRWAGAVKPRTRWRCWRASPASTRHQRSSDRTTGRSSLPKLSWTSVRPAPQPARLTSSREPRGRTVLPNRSTVVSGMSSSIRSCSHQPRRLRSWRIAGAGSTKPSGLARSSRG